jgi:hypothetical protein
LISSHPSARAIHRGSSGTTSKVRRAASPIVSVSKYDGPDDVTGASVRILRRYAERLAAERRCAIIAVYYEQRSLAHEYTAILLDILRSLYDEEKLGGEITEAAGVPAAKILRFTAARSSDTL